MHNEEAEKLTFDSPLDEQLHWAKFHAIDLTIAEHNRKAFAQEVERLTAIKNDPKEPA